MGLPGESWWSISRRRIPGTLTDRYRELFDSLCRLDTTDKQAMAMACLLLGG